jgi:hypothetical protein
MTVKATLFWNWIARAAAVMVIWVAPVPILWGQACTYSLSATNINVPVPGVTGAITVTTGPTCSWTATNEIGISPVTILPPASGTGNGYVNYSAGPNTLTIASVPILVGGQTVTFQYAAPCQLPFSQAVSTVPAQPSYAEGQITRTILPPNPEQCTVVTSGSVPWLYYDSSELGPEVTIQPNTGGEREGVITVAGQPVTIMQEAGNVTPPAPYFVWKQQYYYPSMRGISQLGGRMMDLQDSGTGDLIVWQVSNTFAPVPILAFLDDGTGVYTESTATVFGGSNPLLTYGTDAAIDDFDKNGLPDLFLADNGPDTAPFTGGQSRLFLQNSSHVLVDVTATNVPQENRTTGSLAVSDISHSGWLDVLPMSGYTENGCQPSIYMNTGGVFTKDTTRLPSAVTNCAQNYFGAIFLDVNNDGFDDLILGPSPNSGVPQSADTVLLNDGTGHFSFAPGQPLPPRLGGITWGTVKFATADIDGDGLIDLIALTTPPTYGDTRVQLLLNNGDGTFRDASNRLPQEAWAAANATVAQIFPVDLNGDGHIDLVARANRDVGTVLLNTGNGQFVTVEDWIPFPNALYWDTPMNWPGAREIMVGDVNKDSIPDIVVLPSYSEQFYVGINTTPLPTVPSCGYGIDTTAVTLPSAASAAITVNVTAANANCRWRISSDTPWITITSAYPQNAGSGPASFLVGTNTSSQARSGSVLAAGKIITIAQPGAPCSALLGRNADNLTGAAANLQVTISTVPADCPWTAASMGSFVSITSATSGVGASTVAYSVSANTGAAESGSLTIAGQTLNISQPGLAPSGSAAAAFLDANDAPALTFNGSTSFPDAGGFLIGPPGVAQALDGDVYVVGLDAAGGVHLNSYSFANGTWDGWQYSGGILDTSSGLTAAVDPSGVVWFTGRDIGNRFWINSWNGAGFGGWILVADGIFAPDSVPQIAIPSDGTIYVIGKDIGGRIWSNSYNPTNQTFTGWVDRQAVMIGQPSATAGQDGMVYVAVRSVASESPVYITQIPAQNAATANTWLNGGGEIDTDPQITSQGGTVYLLAEADGDTVYLLTFAESNQTFGAWNFTNGILNDSTVAAAGGNVFIAGRDSLDRIYWYSLTGNNWFFAGGTGVSSTALAGGK